MTEQKYDGQNDALDSTSEYNTDDFVMMQALRAISTATIVKVVGVSNSGTVDKIGTVDVLPLVKLMDAAGKTTSHVKIEKIPYLRSVGGSKGIIMDPKVGDIGIAVFADRDVQVVRQTKGEATPGSRRRFSMADGMYLSAVLADAPTSFLQFEDDGTIKLSPDNGTTFVEIKAGKITLKAATITLDTDDLRLGGDDASRPVSAQGTVTSDGAIDNSNFLTTVKGK
jgi:hypothetical protein